MSCGKNIQFLRKMHHGMTQEELAERMNVSRQTISKWEMESSLPEIGKAIELCEFFSCTLDELLRDDMNSDSDAYQNIHVENVSAFRYVPYTVISVSPENDAKRSIREWASTQGIVNAEFVGWDFPFLSQEQINLYHLHGYTSACIIPEMCKIESSDIRKQEENQYAVITIRDPFKAPFSLIPNAYKTLMRYMEVNGLRNEQKKDVLSCFEKEYEEGGVAYMDVYISVYE